MSIDTEIEREVVAGAGGNADEGKPVGPCGHGHDGERPVAAGHAERIRPVSHGFTDKRRQVLVPAKDEGIDPSLAPSSTSPACAALPPPDRGLTNRTGRRAGSAPRQPYRDRRAMTG